MPPVLGSLAQGGLSSRATRITLYRQAGCALLTRVVQAARFAHNRDGTVAHGNHLRARQGAGGSAGFRDMCAWARVFWRTTAEICWLAGPIGGTKSKAHHTLSKAPRPPN